MIPDEDKFYAKIVEFNEIYNSVVNKFFIYDHLVVKKLLYFCLVLKSKNFNLFLKNRMCRVVSYQSFSVRSKIL